MRIALRSFSGMAGLLLVLSTAVTFAADAVPTVDISGVVLDTEGQPAEVDSARVEELETPDSEAIVTPIDVAADGSFTVALREWGTPEEPAIARFVVFGPRGEPVVINDQGCTEQTTPFGTLEVPIAGAVPTEPVEMVLDQTVIDGLCPPVTATPEPDAPVASEAPAAVTTLPPTDAGGASRAQTGPTGIFAAFLFLAGAAALALAVRVRGRAMVKVSPPTVSSTRRRRPRGR